MDGKNPAKSIEKMYKEEMHKIPYPVFMRCFDRLFVSPPKPDPAEPSDDLKDNFQAVCMAVERGIADTEGRGEARVREFYEHVYPAWKQRLEESDFRHFSDILDGKLKKSAVEDEKDDEPADEGTQEGSGEAVHERMERAMQAALLEEELRERRQAADSEGSGMLPGGGPAESAGLDAPDAAADADSGVTLFKSAVDLSRAVSGGRMPLCYLDIKNKEPFAEYLIGKVRLCVRLVKSERSCYLTLVYPSGYTSRDDAEQRIIAVTSRLGYVEVKDFEYKQGGRNYSLKLKFGDRSTYLACRTDVELSPELFGRALGELDRHLHEIIKEFRIISE